jgi:uncharacterized protein (DUF2237 family)
MNDSTMSEPLNVYDEPLESCGTAPMTGFFRDGCCNTSLQDHGSHTVCVELTEEFLAFSKESGNDLSTPQPDFGFPGLQPGDRWCLCAARWVEALDANAAPRVHMTRTHQRALEIVPLQTLRLYATDLN